MGLFFGYAFYQAFGIVRQSEVNTPQIGDSAFYIFYKTLRIGTNEEAKGSGNLKP
jgi:hypothetical protein